MINKTYFNLSLAILLSSLAMPASAQWYVGGGIGIVTTKIPEDVLNIPGSTASSLSKDDSATVYAIGVGYQFTPNWAIEGGYAANGNLGARRVSTAGTVGTLAAQSDGSAWAVSGIGKLPLQNDFYLFGKLGLAATTTKTTIETGGGVALPPGTPAHRKKSEGNFLWGLGAGYDFNPKFGIRIDYTRTLKVGDDNTGEGDVNTLAAGVQFRF